MPKHNIALESNKSLVAVGAYNSDDHSVVIRSTKGGGELLSQTFVDQVTARAAVQVLCDANGWTYEVSDVAGGDLPHPYGDRTFEQIDTWVGGLTGAQLRTVLAGLIYINRGSIPEDFADRL